MIAGNKRASRITRHAVIRVFAAISATFRAINKRELLLNRFGPIDGIATVHKRGNKLRSIAARASLFFVNSFHGAHASEMITTNADCHHKSLNNSQTPSRLMAEGMPPLGMIPSRRNADRTFEKTNITRRCEPPVKVSLLFLGSPYPMLLLEFLTSFRLSVVTVFHLTFLRGDGAVAEGCGGRRK